MKKPVTLWIIAFLITAASAVYQRMTGPTYPVTERVVLNGKEIRFRLERSHGGEANFPLAFNTGDATVRGAVQWKRLKTRDAWTTTPFVNDNGTLRAELPHQPPAGKLEYRLTVTDNAHTILLPGQGPIVVRFKGEVPLPVIIVHVIVIFAAMLLSTRTVFEILRPVPHFQLYAWWTAGLLFIGGLILGPIVQKYAFDAYWTGWPFGTDLTDNKTAVAFLAWLAAAIQVRRSARPVRWIIGAAIVTLIVFIIPHSMFGSELDYSQVDTSQTP